jgi:hypothetical protein
MMNVGTKDRALPETFLQVVIMGLNSECVPALHGILYKNDLRQITFQ